MRTVIAVIALCLLSSCAYVENNTYVQGNSNNIKMDNSASRSTKDLVDAAGSAYGDVVSPVK